MVSYGLYAVWVDTLHVMLQNKLPWYPWIM